MLMPEEFANIDLEKIKSQERHEGFIRGYEEGHAKGLVDGKESTTIAFITKLLKDYVPVQKIQEYTELDFNSILQLRSELSLASNIYDEDAFTDRMSYDLLSDDALLDLEAYNDDDDDDEDNKSNSDSGLGKINFKS